MGKVSLTPLENPKELPLKLPLSQHYIAESRPSLVNWEQQSKPVHETDFLKALQF